VPHEQRTTNNEQRLSLPLLDCHVHISALAGLEQLNSVRETCGLEAINLLSLASCRDEAFGQNMEVLAAKVRRPGRCYAFGSLRHPRSGRLQDPLPYEEQARRLLAMGCDGMKMLEGKPTLRRQLDMPLDAPQLDAFYTFLERKRVPLLFHVADPETFWDPAHATERLRQLGWYYGDGGYPSKEQLYAEVERALGKHPRLSAVFAHFYFLSADSERLGAFLDRWPHVNVDLTPGGEMYVNFAAQREAARAFFLRYPDRIFFGTDSAAGREPNPGGAAYAVSQIGAMRRFLETEEEFKFWGAVIKGLGLPPDACAKVYAGNFHRWAGQAPKPVDRLAACEECDRLLAMAELGGAEASVVEGLKAARSTLAAG
jgi:predicted TIM-barrel fold metal-dependent hydrolase